MADLRLRVNGKEYGGWKAVRVTRGIESVAGSFELSVFDRWGGQDTPWPIAEEDACQIVIKLDQVGVESPVLTGYIDRRTLAYAATDHSLTVSGRDKAGALVDCSAMLAQWEFAGIPLMTLAKRLAAPFGVNVALQPGLAPPTVAEKLVIDPGESAFEALERACRLAGVLPVSDGAGGIVITRAGSARCVTALVEGENILTGQAQYDASQRFRRYVVTGQHAGDDEFMGDATATVRGEAQDSAVKRAERVLVVRSENSVTPELAKKRAQWEAKVRAARGDALSVRVQGWTQGDGSLWPINARVRVKSPFLGADGEMLISQVTHELTLMGGTTTELALRRPDAFLPEPVIAPPAWKELVGGV